jgi:mono/diheme cytochrome c family protein
MRRDRLASAGALAVVVVGAFALWSDGGALTGGAAPTSATARDGRALYVTHCAACHGGDLAGEANWKSPRPDGSYPAPPHDATGHTWHHGDGTLFRIVNEGGAFYSTAATPSRMPAFGEQLCDAEVQAVIEYLKSTWGPQERRFQAQVSADSPYPPTTDCA